MKIRIVLTVVVIVVVVLVVLFCAAQAVGELCGTGFDVVEAARQKVVGDVARGVRGDGDL